jgi:hypothetical protein
MNQINDIYEGIANRILGIRTLKTQNSDSLDFHELHVSLIKNALEAAYTRGKVDARMEAAKAVLDYTYDGD